VRHNEDTAKGTVTIKPKETKQKNVTVSNINNEMDDIILERVEKTDHPL
jgi:hypothetical protein